MLGPPASRRPPEASSSERKPLLGPPASRRPPEARRRALTVLAVLAAATLAGHAIARRVGDAPAPPPHPIVAAPAPVVTTTGGPVTLAARLDRSAVLRGGDGLVRVELVMTAEERPGAPRVPTDLVVVLDRSGSMAGEKLDLARRAVQDLVARLADDDRFALVVYDSDAQVAVPLATATPAARAAWRGRIDGVEPGGGTALSFGLDAALALTAEPSPGRARRILLLSDGLANEGDTSFEGLTGRAAASARRETPVTAVGVGLDFDERLMGSLADAGTGNYYYLPEGTELAGVFERELDASRETVASALAVTVAPPPGVEVVEAAGYPLESVHAGVVFHPGSLFAGQERRVWLTLRVPDRPEASAALGRIEALFKDGETWRRATLDTLPRVARVGSREEFFAGLDGDAWAAGAAGDAYHRLEERVASYVRDGRRDEALAEIASYRAANAVLNDVVASPEVTEKLEEAENLAAQVDDAFVGPDQDVKQNLLRKERQASSWDGRRQGAKKAAGGGGK